MVFVEFSDIKRKIFKAGNGRGRVMCAAGGEVGNGDIEKITQEGRSSDVGGDILQEIVNCDCQAISR